MGNKADLVDLEHWRSFVRVDPVGPGGFKPSGQGRAALLSYVGNNHTSGRRVIGAELTRHQAENLCAAIMACFEDPEPSQEGFLHEPEEEDHDDALSETLRGVPGAFERYARILEAKAPKCQGGYTLPCPRDTDGDGDCAFCAHGRVLPPPADEPYWQKSFTVTPPPEGLEGGLAETAVVVQAKHGGPVPLTASQVEEFVDAIENAAIAGEQERINHLADLDPIDDRDRKPEDPLEVPDEWIHISAVTTREPLGPCALCRRFDETIAIVLRGYQFCMPCSRGFSFSQLDKLVDLLNSRDPGPPGGE